MMDDLLDSPSVSILQIGRNKSDVTDLDYSALETPKTNGIASSRKAPKLTPCDYVIERRLGSGSFGEVFRAKGGGEIVALKKIPKNTSLNKRSLFREIQAGTRLNHPGIVKFKNFFETENSFYLIYELLTGVDLYSFMRRRNFIPLKETELICLMRQLIEALVYCHSQDTCHRDVKWENIFLTEDGTVKLIDFGLSAHISHHDQCRDFVGSPYCAAPEIIARRSYSGFKADVYSCGMVLFSLLYGRFEIQRSDMGTILWPDRYENDFPFFVGRAVKDLLSGMLEEEPDDRISMEQALKHRWFQKEKDLSDAICKL